MTGAALWFAGLILAMVGMTLTLTAGVHLTQLSAGLALIGFGALIITRAARMIERGGQ